MSLTIQQLDNGSLDLQTLEQFVNGDENTVNNPRLRPDADVGSIAALNKHVKDKVDLQIATLPAGHKGYKTLADAQAGQASLPANTLIEVTNDTDINKNGVYLWNGTTLTKSAYDPKTVAVNEANAHTDEIIKTTTNALVQIADNNGNVALNVANAVSVDIQDDLLVSKSGELETSGISLTQTSNYAYAVSDGSGNIIFAVDKNGKVVNESASTSTTTTYKTGGNYDYEVNHVLNYGQSLSVGQATPAVSTTQKYDNLMFYRGMRPQYDYTSETPQQWYASLQPAIEQASLTNTSLAETPSTATGDAIKELMLSEDNLAYTDLNYQILLSAPGYGATAIVGLSKGTAHYNRMIEQSQYGLSLANAQNKTYAVQAVTWTQGESDYLGNNTQSTYYNAMRQLITDINTDVKAVTKQTKDIPLISYQVASHKVAGRTVPNVALAQLQAETDDPLIYIACAMYQFDYLHSNNFHLIGVSSRWLGAYYGLAYKRIVIDKQNWQPLKPLSAIKQNNAVVITFNVPFGKLVFDTEQVTQNTNYGFELVDSAGIALTISSVSITSRNTVKIVAANTIPSGAKVRYAWSGAENVGRQTGPRGNLRDTQGDAIVFDKTGINKRLDNWCLIFEMGV